MKVCFLILRTKICIQLAKWGHFWEVQMCTFAHATWSRFLECTETRRSHANCLVLRRKELLESTVTLIGKWKRAHSKLLLSIFNTICLPPLLSFLHLRPHLPGGAVVCPLRGGESVTCHFAPSSYDTRWHSTPVRASAALGSGDQIIALPGSIPHIPAHYPENRSHAICVKLPALSTTHWTRNASLLTHRFRLGHVPN